MTSAPAVKPPAQQAEDAAYWKKRFEQERERVVKLWLAYKTLEATTKPRDEKDAG